MGAMTVTPVSLRRRSVTNLLSMGHCAPAVMQTLIDAARVERPWLVLAAAGLPGGIGNTGGECGGLTAPLLVLGVRFPRDEVRDGLPVMFDRGHSLLSDFVEATESTLCREIRGGARLPFRCIGIVSRSTKRCAECAEAADPTELAPEARASYAALYTHWMELGFHCADDVLANVAPRLVVPQSELRDAVTAFAGGTLMCGMTCSALTAGVIALGIALGEIERSAPRVLRMLATMAVGRDAFADELNAFNRVMNLGNDLAVWFDDRFGSTQCRALTGRDFAVPGDVEAYITSDETGACRTMAHAVAERVSEMIRTKRLQELTT